MDPAKTAADTECKNVVYSESQLLAIKLNEQSCQIFIGRKVNLSSPVNVSID